MGREEPCRQTSLAYVGSARSVWATLGFPCSHGVCAFPVYTAQAPGCSACELSEVGPGLRALPRPKPLRFRFLGTPQGADSVMLHFVPFPGPSSSGHQVLGSALSPGGAVHVITSPSQLLDFRGSQQECRLRCAMCLLWGADLWLRPSCWMSVIQGHRKTWLATGSFLAVW